jgi:hypothetical protein
MEQRKKRRNQILCANFRTVLVLNCKDSLHGVHVDTCYKAEDVPLNCNTGEVKPFDRGCMRINLGRIDDLQN